LLWTPGYWGWSDGFYVWHAGYWGPVVGFYGGINYGFGYTGVGFFGGYWRGGNYYYNRSVTNVNVNVIHNTYNTTVVNNTTINRVSYNGGPAGIDARPTREEMAAEHERHVSMTAEQNRHFDAARGDRRLLASVNHGRPDAAATPRSGEFKGRGVERGRNRPDDRADFNHPERAQENNGRIRDDRPPSARSPPRAAIPKAAAAPAVRKPTARRQTAQVTSSLGYRDLTASVSPGLQVQVKEPGAELTWFRLLSFPRWISVN
jgi:hypothetical protein